MEDNKTILNVIALHEQIEKIFKESLIKTTQGTELQLQPQFILCFFHELELALTYCWSEGYKKTALLCNPRIRLHVRRLIEKKFPTVPVLSYAEIAPGFTVRVLKTLSLPFIHREDE